LIFGYKKHELIGQLMDRLIPDRFQNAHVGSHENYAKNPYFQPMLYRELCGRKKDGTEVPLEIALSHVKTDDGDLYLSFTTDITERKRVEAELKKTREEFIAILTHDLKNPLSAIMGFADLLEKSLTGEIKGDNLAYLSMIHQAGDTMFNLISNIVSASKIDSGKMVFNFSDFSLSDLIENLKKMFFPLFQQKKIVFSSLCPGEIRVNGDCEKLRQVFENLLINALRYTPSGGTIGINARTEGDRVTVEVYDTGKGIPLPEQGALFQKFKQVRGERKGTGLGLYIVKNIIEEHGSVVKLESEPGKGTRFFFTLPGSTESLLQREERQSAVPGT
jgi:PAS domain S-box-containing protein